MDNNNFFEKENSNENNHHPAFDKYKQYYSDSGFFNKIKKHYKTIGKKLIKLVTVLFYTLRDKDTPSWAKTIVLGALGYFIFPLDLIPDFVPVVGFVDDFAAITIAIASVALHIKDTHRDRASAILKKIFKD